MRRRLAAAATALVILGVVALALLLVDSTRDSRSLTRSAYLKRVSAVCRRAGERLDQIPPIQDPTLLGDVLASVNAALPILTDQRDRVRMLVPPVALRREVNRFFVLTDRSIEILQSVRAAALKMNVGEVAMGLERFGTATIEAKSVARLIGYRC
jgi:hypothetical protein